MQELADLFLTSPYLLKKDLEAIKHKLPNWGKRRPFTPYEVEIIKKHLLEGM